MKDELELGFFWLQPFRFHPFIFVCRGAVPGLTPAERAALFLS